MSHVILTGTRCLSTRFQYQNPNIELPTWLGLVSVMSFSVYCNCSNTLEKIPTITTQTRRSVWSGVAFYSGPGHFHTEADKAPALPTAAAKQWAGQSTSVQLNILLCAFSCTHAHTQELNPWPSMFEGHVQFNTVYLSTADSTLRFLQLRPPLPHKPNVISLLWCDLCVRIHKSKKKSFNKRYFSWTAHENNKNNSVPLDNCAAGSMTTKHKSFRTQ